MENITINDADFAKILPEFMKNDITDMALAEMVNFVMEKIYPRIIKLSIWNQLENMDETELDQLADYLAISWYWYGATIEQKRQIIKDARKVHRHLGTVWALQYVLTIYFGEAKIIEWPDYGGDYGHFKIETYNQDAINEKAEEFLKIVNLIKRTSATLDEIVVYASSSMDNYYIIKPHTTDFVTTEIAF
ncbi:phage tail protein [Lachnospiraceae bacterium HCP1S3_A10]